MLNGLLDDRAGLVLGDSDMILVDIKEALDRVLETLDSEFEQCADVITDYGDVPGIPCQPAALVHVLVNILREIEHTLGGPGKVRIRTRRDGQFAVIEFETTGAATSRFQFPRMFEENETSGDSEEWNRFHVAAVYDFVDRQHGRFIVEDRPDSGTTLTMRLPIDLQEEANEMR